MISPFNGHFCDNCEAEIFMLIAFLFDLCFHTLSCRLGACVLTWVSKKLL